MAGVNAYLSDHHGGGLPVEFALMRVSPEPWTGEDVVAWQKTMAWQLSANWRDELLRVQLAARVGDEGAALLMPPYTPGGPVILPPDAVLRSEPLGSGAPSRPRRRASRPASRPTSPRSPPSWTASRWRRRSKAAATTG